MLVEQRTPIHSPEIGKLVEALSKAQGEMPNAPKQSENPFFKSSYADLATCIDTTKPHLAKFGLALTQHVAVIETKLTLISLLSHTSGQWLASYYPITSKDNSPQAIGSAVTYARRYSLQAILGIASSEDDDDGNSAQPGILKRDAEAHKIPPTLVTDPQLKRLRAIQHKCHWSDEDMKNYISQLGLSSSKELNWLQYNNLCKRIEQFPKEQND